MYLHYHRFYRSDRQSGDHRGVALAASSTLKHKHIPSPITSVIETVTVSVETPAKEIVFISANFKC